MGQYFAGMENIPPIVKTSATSLTLASTYLSQPTLIRVSGQAYQISSTLTCNTATIGAGGLDTGTFISNQLYHIYLVISNNAPSLIISTTGPTTGPTGFTSNFRYLGKVRTLAGSAAFADDVGYLFLGNGSNFVVSDSVNSEIRLYGPNAAGGSSSGDTRIQNFVNVITNIGSAITYTPRTSTTGDFFTINESGIYAITTAMYESGANYIGISKNTTQTSTSILSLTNKSEALAMHYQTGGDAQSLSVTTKLVTGDIIRAHRSTASATVSPTDPSVKFSIVQILKI